MKTPADKSPEPRRQAAAHEALQQQDSTDAELKFVDNRSETARLRQLQETIDNSPRRQSMLQLKALMNSSPRRDAMRSLQAKVDNSPHRASMRLQAGVGDVPVQRVEDEDVLQREFAAESPAQLAQPPEVKPNNTGLPDNLKAGVESLSGLSLDNVKVHYNSSKPAQLNAHAYAQGMDIHVGPGQGRHLPHEAWHVVQQAQGRVKPTMQMKDGVGVNDDAGLEAEADLMGGKAVAGTVPAAKDLNTEGGGVSMESDPIDTAIQRYVDKGEGVKVSKNEVFAVVGDGANSKLFVDADTVALPKFQHVDLDFGDKTLAVNQKNLTEVVADYEDEDELAAMFCGKFSEMITGIKETEENETAEPGRSLYVNKLFDIEGDYNGAWVNHFAPVIVADDSDRGTLETAVGIDFIWFGIYGKARGQSFRYKTIVADVMLQLNRERVEPQDAKRILDYLEDYAQAVIPEEEVPDYIRGEILAIETQLKKMVALGPKQANPTELPSAKREREELEAQAREAAQNQLVSDICDNVGDWEEQIKQSHKFTLRSKIRQALESADLTEEQRVRLQSAREMVTEQQAISSGSHAELRSGSGPSLLQVIGGFAVLAVLGGLLFWARSGGGTE